MFTEHSIAETAQRPTCLADSSVNFSVIGAITGYGTPQIFEMGRGWLYGAGWWSTSVFLRLIVRLKSLDATEKQSNICCRSCSAWAISAQSSAKRTSWRRVCRLFVFAVSQRRSKREPSKR